MLNDVFRRTSVRLYFCCDKVFLTLVGVFLLPLLHICKIKSLPHASGVFYEYNSVTLFGELKMNVTLFNTTIRQDKRGRYCLNDLYTAVSSCANALPKNPIEFLCHPLAVELIKNGKGAAISVDGDHYANTYLSVSYLLSISPAALEEFLKQIDVPIDVPETLSYGYRDTKTGEITIKKIVTRKY